MEKKYAEFVGVESLYVSKITSDTENAYIAEKPEFLAPTAELTQAAETNNAPQYYDNVPGFNYITEGITTVAVTISGIPADKLAALLGKKYDASSGRVLDSGRPNPPDYALSFMLNKGPDGYRYYQYLKGNFSGGSEDGATKQGGSIQVKTYKLTFTAVVTSRKWIVNGEPTAIKRIFADSMDPAFSGSASWFSKVQTPDTGTAPGALVLSSSVPANAAAAVAVSSSIALTFTTPIEDYAYTLIKTGTGTAVACDASLDVGKKVLTIKPTVNLGAATAHILVISSVADVFGQSLKDQVINFTTA